MITGCPPFHGAPRDQLLQRIRFTDPRPPRAYDETIPRDLETICLQAMRKEPARRYDSATALARDLRNFAGGRKINARRITRLARNVRYVRRHKLLCTSIIISLVAAALGTIVIAGSARSQRREASRLLSDAYGKLAYHDYRQPDLVSEDLDRAEALGAAGPDFLLTRALFRLGRSDEEAAMNDLTDVLAMDPNNGRALYLLAWAHWRIREYGPSRDAFSRAEQLTHARSADEWFFRGLAAHFNDPAVAVDSYRRANAERIQSHDFYPQALLHLARAQNQQMYKHRSLETFEESRAGLRQLVANGHYGAYPYYLLSIAHRLAGEIGVGKGSSDGKSHAHEHFERALAWARRGQVAEPTDTLVTAAEAQCLEALGRFDDAIAARTRTIELSTKQKVRCEAYHYRWRLYYWTGQNELALEDIARHSQCMPESRFYAYIYPAMVFAEDGLMDKAVTSILDLSDAHRGNALDIVWSASALRLLGQSARADELLRVSRGSVAYVGDHRPDSKEWMEDLYRFCLEGPQSGALRTWSADGNPDRRLQAEGFFHAGVMLLGAGKRREALEYFDQAHQCFDGELHYSYHAKLVAERLRGNPTWPAWIEDKQGDRDEKQ